MKKRWFLRCSIMYFYFLEVTNSQFSILNFTQGVAIGLDLFKPIQGITRGYQLLILNAHLTTLTSQFSILNSQFSTAPSTFLVFSFYLLLFKNSHLSTLNSQPSPLNSHLSTLNSQPSPLNSHLSTLTSQPLPLNPQLSTLNSQPSTLNSHLSTLLRLVPDFSILWDMEVGRCWLSTDAVEYFFCKRNGWSRKIMYFCILK